MFLSFVLLFKSLVDSQFVAIKNVHGDQEVMGIKSAPGNLDQELMRMKDNDGDIDKEAMTGHGYIYQEVITSNGYPDQEVMIDHGYMDQEVMTSNGYLDQDVVIDHEYMDQEVMTSNGYLDQEVMIDHGYLDQEVMTAHDYKEGPVIHREGDPCESSFKPRVECAEGLICLNSWKKEKKGKTATCEKVLTIHGEKKTFGQCVNQFEKLQIRGRITIGSKMSPSECLSNCMIFGTTGCEWISPEWFQKGSPNRANPDVSSVCRAHTGPVKTGSKRHELALCFIFNGAQGFDQILEDCSHIKFGFTIVTTLKPMNTWHVESADACAEECKSTPKCLLWSYEGCPSSGCDENDNFHRKCDLFKYYWQTGRIQEELSLFPSAGYGSSTTCKEEECTPYVPNFAISATPYMENYDLAFAKTADVCLQLCREHIECLQWSFGTFGCRVYKAIHTKLYFDYGSAVGTKYSCSPECVPYKRGVNLAAKDFFKTVRAENEVPRMTEYDCLESCRDNDDCLQWNFGAFRDGLGCRLYKTLSTEIYSKFGSAVGTRYSCSPGEGTKVTKFSGYCLDSNGKEQKNGFIRLTNKKYPTADDCLKACKTNVAATGCEHYAPKQTCLIHTAEVVSGGGSGLFLCFVLKRKGPPPDSTQSKFPGLCLDSNGRDQNTGVKPLSGTYATFKDCLKACYDPSAHFFLEATGCEYYAPKKTCSIHTAEVVSGGGTNEFTCYLMKKRVTRFPGTCLDSRGKVQKSGNKPLPNTYNHAENCLKACNAPTGTNYLELTGCEYHKSRRTCSIHTAEVVSGGGNANTKEFYTCFVFENKRGATGKEKTRTTSEPFEKLWSDEQCPNIGQGPKTGKLHDCENKCLGTPTCTAIHFSPKSPKDCVLRACPKQVPQPTWKYKNYKGYTVTTGKEKTITSPCFLVEDIDYPGMDLNLSTGSTSDRKKSALECRALCNETPLCKIFTWKADINECWIKDGIGRKENQIGATSGSACRECPCFLFKDIDYPGMDLNLATGSTADRKKSALECRALCNETPLCKFFTWKADINECWIKDGISRKENQIGATSGSACREESPGKEEMTTKSPGKEETTTTTTTKSPGKSRCNTINPSPPKPWGKDELFIDCPIEWTTFDRRCYKFIFTNEPQDFTFAKSLQHCVDLFPDVKLVQIDSQHQQRWIEKQIQTSKYNKYNKISQPFHISKPPKDIEMKQKRNEGFYFGPISGVTPVHKKLIDPKMCMAAVYDPLLCIAPWQYMLCSATLHVKSIVCMFEQKQKGLSPTDHGPYDKIWTDDQCKNLGRGSKVRKLKNCEYSCLVTPKCTAISYSPSDCVLRGCPIPIPRPKWKHLNYKGYTVLRYPGSTTDPLSQGPFDQIWTDEQCPNVGEGNHEGNLEDCKNACHLHLKCNAVNFSSDDCVLRACPFSIPKPKWSYKGYKGYST